MITYKEGLETVCRAGERLAGVAVRTPLVRNEYLDAVAGGEVVLKLENLQRTGSFKFRGAYNCISGLDRALLPGGVVAYSTGNHGAAVARSGRLAGISVTLVLPWDAPKAKIESARADGADLVFYDPLSEDREAISQRIVAEKKARLVPPGEDLAVLGGQGTTALEIVADMNNRPPDFLLVPCGGGGLAAGCALALRGTGAKTTIVAIEPEGFDSMRRSLHSGTRQGNEKGAVTVCDALRAPMPADLAFDILSQPDVPVINLVVSNEEATRAVRWAWANLKIVLEPSGATPLAAFLGGKMPLSGKSAACILSGGNVEPKLYSDIIGSCAENR